MSHTIPGTCVSVEYLVLGMLENNVYIISDGSSVFVVDPSCEPDRIMKALNGRVPEAIVLTHRHFDHVGAAEALRERTGAPVVASVVDAPMICGDEPTPLSDRPFTPCPVDRVLKDGETFQVGSMPWKVIATPGHTPGGMCLYLDARDGSNPKGAPVLVSGDTLFAGSIGRTDFAGGSLKQMRASLKRLATLPNNTKVLPGHGPTTTIGAERGPVFARFA
ncbi:MULTISPECIES: MBL fold metallo-hydrolase [Gordonibacter]|uniref:MBL fold metallo-hydrolase n=1 Tax=Gordonibacter faecis TaxID=3047475 RepID=A0ABT7DK88_9ACTN|nr:MULTISPECIES: MBL fold metallo-hydrolase [unclassified Gordonibacter]MDJ1649807.1 MBL fold metallo-hydrolase [Gordonibacter sp. KGMB12511]HIW75472.1 MBL fold metallo-hydrolase [Candidatus Gordonibacter avicola]